MFLCCTGCTSISKFKLYPYPYLFNQYISRSSHCQNLPPYD
jgi:hypothetical protein